jgi:hypothetical protein
MPERVPLLPVQLTVHSIKVFLDDGEGEVAKAHANAALGILAGRLARPA